MRRKRDLVMKMFDVLKDIADLEGCDESPSDYQKSRIRVQDWLNDRKNCQSERSSVVKQDNIHKSKGKVDSECSSEDDLWDDVSNDENLSRMKPFNQTGGERTDNDLVSSYRHSVA